MFLDMGSVRIFEAIYLCALILTISLHKKDDDDDDNDEDNDDNDDGDNERW